MELFDIELNLSHGNIQRPICLALKRTILSGEHESALELYLNPLFMVPFVPDGEKKLAQSLAPNPNISLEGGAIPQHLKDIPRRHLGRFNRNLQHGLRTSHPQHIEHFHRHGALLFQAVVSVIVGLKVIQKRRHDLNAWHRPGKDHKP